MNRGVVGEAEATDGREDRTTRPCVEFSALYESESI